MAVASRSGAVGVRRARRGARRARPSPLCLPPDGVKRLRYSAALQSPSPLGPSVARLRPGPVCAPLAVVVVAWFRPPPPCSAFRAPGVGPPRGVGARGPGGRPGVVVWPRVPGRPAAALGLSAASPSAALGLAVAVAWCPGRGPPRGGTKMPLGGVFRRCGGGVLDLVRSFRLQRNILRQLRPLPPWPPPPSGGRGRSLACAPDLDSVHGVSLGACAPIFLNF